MCWGIDFWIGKSPGNEKIAAIMIDDIAGLRALYARYGKDVPEEVFDTDFFDEGKRIPYNEIDQKACLCSADQGMIVNFVARAIMKETRGIDVGAPLDAKQEVIYTNVVRRIKGVSDHFTSTTFHGKDLHVTIGWL